MISDDSPSREGQHFPREGARLFWLLVAGLVVQAIVMRLVWIASGAYSGGAAVNVQVLSAVVAMAGHGWQAWLLFDRAWRRICWTLIPTLIFVAPTDYRWIQLCGVIAPLVEAVLLNGVRQRVWAWILAGMGQVILGAAGTALSTMVAARMRGQIPLVSESGLMISVLGGMWLVLEVAAVAVLAWWMPPVTTRENRTASPPRPESTDG